MPDPVIPLHRPIIIGTAVEIRPGRVLDVAVHVGRQAGAPVAFFCHGAGGNKDQWRIQWQTLANEGYSLVAWDLYGHGDSPKPDQPDAYAWDELVEDYLAILSLYSGPRNVLVAHSFGTGLTLSVLSRLRSAQSGPQVESALLLGSLLSRPAFKPGLLSLPAWALKLIRPWLARSFRLRAWHPQANPVLVAYEDKLTERNELYVFKALTSQARWPTLQQLSALELPVSVLAGDSDGLTPAESGRALAEHLPNARFDLLPACGHQLMLEKPSAVLSALRALLIGRPVGSSSVH